MQLLDEKPGYSHRGSSPTRFIDALTTTAQKGQINLCNVFDGKTSAAFGPIHYHSRCMGSKGCCNSGLGWVLAWELGWVPWVR